MKRTLILATVLMMLLVPAFGQDMHWGAQLGFSVATFIGEDADAGDFDAKEKETKGGFVFGAFFDARFTEYFGVRPELFYVSKGVSYDYDDGDVSIFDKVIDAPVLMNFFLPIPTEALDVHVFAGPVPSLILSTKYEYDFGTNEEQGDWEDDGIDGASFDVGLMFGAGVGIPAGPGKVIVDLRYNLGLLNLVTDVEADSEFGTEFGLDEPEWKNAAFMMTVGYGFKL